MIQIIYGAKGSGKTKRIIAAAQDVLSNAKGDIVFITDTSKYSTELSYRIRFANTDEYEIKTETGLLGFIKGMVAGNHDIEAFFIDGAARICGEQLCEMENFYRSLGNIIADHDIKFFLTVSADIENIPEFIKKYI